MTATRPGGYHGSFLRVDVGTGACERVPLEANVLRRYIGGSGLGVHLVLHEGAADRDALHPSAPVAFVFSPLVGSPLTTSAKFAVVSKSPLTQRINDALSSSSFAIAGKRTGCDAIVIVGRASQPSLLIIEEGRARIEAAADLWGLSSSETEQQIRSRYGSDFQAAVIGPAGEKQVRFASLSHAGRHAGRGGTGAVLGAKNIKAVLVRGTQRTTWADPARLKLLAKEVSEKSFGPATAKYRELGTASNLLVFNRLQALPTRNFQQGSFEGAHILSPEALSVARERTRASCAACTIGCEHIYALDDQHGGDGSGVRLEYENLFALGPLCGVRDSQTVLAASRRCDELGLDTISTGGTIAFAMECVERGLLDAPWLRFGDGASLLDAIEQIGERRGLGDLLAEGSRRLAGVVGQGSIDFAPQVKGLEIPGYEPRALQTMALGFAVGARGADHNRSGAYEVDFSDRVDRRRMTSAAAHLAIETEDKAALMDSLILCKFLRGIFDDFFAEAAEMLNLVTGWDTTADELRRVACRIIAAKKAFNIRAGWTPAEDTLPARFLQQPLQDDPQAQLGEEQLQAAIAMYNQHRGWSPEGWIDAGQLRALGIDDNSGVRTPAASTGVPWASQPE